VSEEAFTFSIGPDGDVTVRSYEELQKWIEKERALWAWLVRGDATADRHNIATYVQNAWDNIVTNVQNLRNQGRQLKETQPYLAELSGSPLLVSTTSKGTAVLDIRDAAGVPAAAFAYGFLNSQFNLTNAQNQADLTGAILTVFPNLTNDADWHERLKRERVNFKNATRSAIERVDREADERIAANVALTMRASRIAKRLFDKRRDKWIRVQSTWQEGASKAVSDLKATEAAYLEYMRLKAPVEYWDKKKGDHEKGKALTRLCIYFPSTIVVMAIAFYSAARVILNNSTDVGNPSPTALYVVISGGLLLLSTVAFWIGRILTKLYLSEHHLRNDAEERAVMATTYLALTNEGAAGENERQIVLNALFRPTPDGIVKDDGPTDASLQGLIARLATK